MVKCKCGKSAGVKVQGIFVCVECLADTIALAFAIKRAVGDEDMSLTGTFSISPEVFSKTLPNND